VSQETIASKIRHIHHFTLPVRDLDRAIRFYCEVLGAELLKIRDPEEDAKRGVQTVRHAWIRLGAYPRIDLFPQTYGQPELEQSHPHFAFSVPGPDLLVCTQILAKEGIPYDGPTRIGPPGSATMYFDDPDGNHLELCCSEGYPEGAPIRLGAVNRSHLGYHWPR